MAQYIAKYLLVILLFAPLTFAQQDLDALARGAVSALKNPRNGNQQYAMPEFTVELSDDPALNAFANPETHVITVNKVLMQILARDPGELLFVIAHEVGHIQDAGCHTRGMRAGLRGQALLRYCEATADKIGMQYILAAGYNPFEPAGVMGKLLMADPSQGSVIGIVLGRVIADHPVSVDRIKQLGQYAREACHDRPEICRQ